MTGEPSDSRNNQGASRPFLLPTRQPVRWSRVWQKLGAVLRPPQTSVEDRNAWYLQVEILWAGILSAAAAFGSNFAVRLGASNQLIGLMSSVPALLVVILTLPAARLIESRRNPMPLLVGSLFAYRLGFLAIALMPFFVPRHQAEVFVGLVLLMNAVLAPFNAGWSALLADIVPERNRAIVFARRNIIASAAVIVLVPPIGRLLDLLVFPYGYQLAYGIGFLAGMLSTWDVSKLTVPERVITPRRQGAKEPLSRATLRRLLAHHQGFIRITLNTFVFGWGAWMVGPLYIIYYLRQLGASDAWVGTLTAVANLSAMIGYYLWPRLIARYGENRILKWTIPTGGIFPIWASLARNLTPILGAAGVDGMLMAGVNLSHFNILLKVTPADRRPSYISLYTVCMNAGAFVAPLIGVALADRIGITTVLLIGGAIRTVGGILFWLLPVLTGGAAQPAPPAAEPA